MKTFLDTVRHIIDTLATPGDQDGWYGWASNQGTHIFLGMCTAAFISPILAITLYVVLKEMTDWLLRDGEFGDSLIDAGYFSAGATAMLAMQEGSSAAIAMSIPLTALAVGTFLRALFSDE